MFFFFGYLQKLIVICSLEHQISLADSRCNYDLPGARNNRRRPRPPVPEPEPEPEPWSGSQRIPFTKCPTNMTNGAPAGPLTMDLSYMYGRTPV